MLGLLIRRFEFNNLKKMCKSFLILIFIFTVLYSLSLLLIMIYENRVSQYYEASYDYVLTNFDEKIMESVGTEDFVEDIYATRLLSTTLRNGSREQTILLNLVDEWDKRSISYLGLSRRVKGSLNGTQENSIILDVLTARKLNLDVGDTIDLYFNNVKSTYKIQMLIKPDSSTGFGVGVALYNSYFLSSWEKAFSDIPPYSLLFVETNDEARADQYFYHEYVGFRMEGQSKEDNEINNYQSNIKKSWTIEEEERNLEFAPPITIIVSLLGCIALFIFIWRETSSKMVILNKNLAIFSTMGMRSSYLIRYFLISSCSIQVPAIFIASLIVKTIVYDLLITNYYLSWELLWYANLITVVFAIFTSFVVSIGVCHKFKKTSISKILAVE